jgi:hypothetical protein
MSLIQKAITPQLSNAYLTAGWDRVSGFVVEASTVAFATTPAQLFDVHALGFPGSPFSPDDPFVDVIRFPARATMRLENATGGVDQKTRALTGGPFVDRPPFKGTGFAPVAGHIVPVWWMRHTRVVPNTQLVRVFADGTEKLLAVFANIADGWLVDGESVGRSTPFSRHVGTLAKWNDMYLTADVVDQGRRIVLATHSQPSDERFVRTGRGMWKYEIPFEEAEEVMELDIEAVWNGLELRIVDESVDADGTKLSSGSYVGHNADLAEGLRLIKVDAGVYEITVPTAMLEGFRTTQLSQASWAD